MAGNERFEDSIGKWLEEAAPTRLPGRVLDATFERTRRTRQETAWRTVPGRLQMPRFVPALGGAAVVVMAAALALNLMPRLGPSGPPTPSPSATAWPTEAPEVTALLNGFLGARVAGAGAQQYLSVPEEDVPLLYATTSGAPFERAEFEQVRGIDWPGGRKAFKVRLFADGTVVEQLFFLLPDEPPLGLGYLPDGFGTEIAPTTEDGQPVPRLFSTLDDEVTLKVAHPWVGWRYGEAPYGYVQTAIRLIPAGAGPTIDGAQRGDWDHFALMADPAWVGTDCLKGPDPADAAALAESILSDSGLEATAPVAVSVGGAQAWMVDVKIAAGTPLCVPATWGGDPLLDVGLLHHVFDVDAPYVANHDDALPEWERLAKGVATGQWMRLYLIDVPAGLSMRILAVAIIAPESRFERTVEAAAPVVDSIEFHAP
jgi:hypothetical protein